MEMWPSEVRKRVLQDHEVLKERIERVRVLADSASAGDGDALELFTETAGGLLSFLTAHLALEDEILIPTLQGIDAWGPERAAQVTAEHIAQRQWIKVMEQELGAFGTTQPEIIERMRLFLDRLLQDIELEESTVLREELLRSYPFPTDFGGG